MMEDQTGGVPLGPITARHLDWQRAALRVGEELASVGPDGYYDFTPQQWLDWARATLRTRAATEPR